MPVSSQHRNTSQRLMNITRANAPALAELARIETGRVEPARNVVFSPDSKTIAATMLDQVTAWDVNRQRKLFTRVIPALNIAFSPDGETLVATGRNVVFLDARTGDQVMSLKGHERGTNTIAFNTDGRLLASGGRDGLVRVGDIQTRRLMLELQHDTPVHGLAYSPDNHTLATVAWGDDNQPGSISFWDVDSGQMRHSLPCQHERFLSYSPDGRFFAADGRVFDANTFKELYDLKDRMVAFSPDSTVLASCRSDYNTIALWEADTGSKLAIVKGHEEPVLCVSFSPDGRFLASGSGKIDMRALLRGEIDPESGDKSIRLWGVLEDDPDQTDELKTPSRKSRPRRPLRKLYEE